MDDFLLNILDIIAKVPTGAILLVVFFIGMYVFWRGCMETGKDRSSTFDIYMLSLMFGIGIGRLGYILSNISEFNGFIWYWSPYEKYGDVIYIFRLLPWRFFRIWDGGILIISMFVGFLLLAMILTIFIKKWRWRQMFFTIFFSGVLMLAFSFLYTSAVTSSIDTFEIALILFVLTFLFFVCSLIITRKKVKWVKRKKNVAYFGTAIVLVTVGYLNFKFLSGNISIVEQISIYLLDLWTFISTILFVSDMKRKKGNIEKVSSVQSISLPEINQPIRLPVDEKR